jgi:hypothetical protein
MMPHHRNMVRSLCRVRSSFGGGVAHALATVRFSPARGKAPALSRWLAADALRSLPQRKGLTSAHLLESRPMPDVPTAEQKIRGGDARADWILLLGGYDAETAEAVLGKELAPDAFVAHGALPGDVRALFRPSYSLTSKDVAK